MAASFERGDCGAVTKRFRLMDRTQLDPLLEAVGGYCETDFQLGEKILFEASQRDHSDDLIAFLRAKKIWMRSHDESTELWQQALLLARRPTLRNLIQNYLTGQGESAELTGGKKNSVQASVAISGFREDNPYYYGTSDQRLDPTGGVETDSEFNTSHTTQFGNWRLHGTLKTMTYFKKHDVDFTGVDIDLPVNVKVGDNEDIIFTALGGYSEQGPSSLQSYYGLGIQGVSYHQNYKQSVQGLIYTDNLYPDLVKAQGGFHARFDYAWEWFSGSTTFRISPFVEHITSDADLDTSNNQISQIPYTYTSVGANISVDQYWKRFTFALDAFSSFRFDNSASNYYSAALAKQVNKTRNDQGLILRLSVSYALQSNLQLVGWYEWNRTWSNIGTTDYQDRNFADQIVAAGVRYSFFSF